jgi:lipopolysaccharide transport system permease protein
MHYMRNIENKRFGSEEIIIRPSVGWHRVNLAALWKRRGLLYFLTLRDLKVRYKQTLLGIAWVILQPFLIMVLFSAVFGFLARMPSEGVPYPLFSFCALVPWQLVSNAFADASNSLIVNQNLIRKIYFPRLIFPLAAVFARLVDFFFALLVLFAMLFYYGVAIDASICVLPLFILLAVAAGLGVGLWLAALNAKYRDVRQMTPFLTQFWFFLSPIAYSASLIPENWRVIYSINPMVGVIEGFRWALLGRGGSLGHDFWLSVPVVILVVVTGLHYFRRIERTVADIV